MDWTRLAVAMLLAIFGLLVVGVGAGIGLALIHFCPPWVFVSYLVIIVVGILTLSCYFQLD